MFRRKRRIRHTRIFGRLEFEIGRVFGVERPRFADQSLDAGFVGPETGKKFGGVIEIEFREVAPRRRIGREARGHAGVCRNVAAPWFR
jgi:hypothetical protein